MHYGRTRIVLCDDYEDLGERAADQVAAKVREVLSTQDELRVVFAAGESQSTFCRSMARRRDIEWDRITCFNMDDFWDTRLPKQFTCGNQTERELYEKITCKKYHLVDYKAPDPEAEATRFEALLREAPLDILCQGIGTSGHLALNEPGQTTFADDRWVRVVDLVEQSKKQLIDDPNFKDLGYIPDRGITMTIPALMSARHVFTMVPLALKKPILTRLLETDGPTEDLPASILHTAESVLFVDRDSCPDKLLPV